MRLTETNFILLRIGPNPGQRVVKIRKRQRMAHRSHTELFYHFAWATSNREKMISPAWEESLFEFLAEKCLSLHCPSIKVNGTEDHIHVLLRGNPMDSPAQIAHDLKGASSHMINAEKFSRLPFVWQDGYGVFTVSPHDVNNVARYIQNQKKHHAEETLRSELEIDL